MMRSKNRKQRTIMLSVLCCMLVFMGIGYSIFSTELNIGGTTTATNTWSILIESITPIENQTGAESKSATVDDVTKTGVSFSAQFQGPGDYMEYDVVVTNKGSIDARLETITNTITPESDAGLFEFTNNLVQGEGLKAGASRTFRVKVLFKPNATTLPTGQMTFNLDLNYIQGEGTDIGGGNGGADTTWDYKVDESGTITAYNYELGKDLVVPAEVNGVPVTTITSDSFRPEGNVLVYYVWGESFYTVYAILDEENFDAIKSKFIQNNNSYCESAYSDDVTGMEECKTSYENQNYFYRATDPNFVAPEGEQPSEMYVNPDPTVPVEESFDYGLNPKINTLDLSEATSLTSIQSDAFNNAGITNVEFGDNSNITTIGDYAFANNKLTNIEIPASVETIGEYAFYHDSYSESATKLETVTFETRPVTQNQLNQNSKYLLSRLGSQGTKLASQKSALKSIGNSAFYENAIKSLTLPEGIETIGNVAFYGNGIEGQLTLPSTLTSIGPAAFQQNKISGELVLPNNLTVLSDSAFSSNLITKITIPSTLTSIGSYAFQNNKITNLTIPSTLTSIGSSAFYNNRLTNLTIPSTLTSIGYSAFKENSFENVVIESCTTNTCSGSNFSSIKELSVVSGEIGSSAFNNNSLQKLTLGEGVTSIGGSSFADNQIAQLTIPSSLETIGYSAFQNNNITNLTIPKTVTSIDNQAFDGNSFENLTIEEAKREVCSTFWINSIKSLTIESGEINCSFSSSTPSLENLVLGEGVTLIGRTAFQDNLLTRVEIPSTVQKIEFDAFENNMISEVVFKPNNGLEIGDSAFANNQISGHLVLPEGLTKLGNYVFQTNQITNLTIPSTLTDIGVGIFLTNPNLSTVFINRTEDDFTYNVNGSAYILYNIPSSPIISYKQS